MSKILISLASLAVSALLLFFGGNRPYLSLPAYGLIAFGGLLSLFRTKHLTLERRHWPCLFAAVLLFGYVILRAVTSPAAYIARADLNMALAALIIYLTFALFLTSSRQRTQFVAVALLVAAGNVIVAGIQFSKGHNFMPFSFLPRGDYGARGSGFFGCPNHLAGFLEITMLAGISFASWSRYGLLLRITAGYLSAMSGAGILLSGSRGGYASSVIGLATFGFVSLLLAGKWLRREFWYAAICSVVVAALALAFTVRSVLRQSEFLQYRVESVNLDVGVRAALAKAALRQFQVSPWFGTGSRTYLFYGREFREPLIQTDPEYAHNDYAQFLAEYGVVGFAGFVVFLGFHLYGGWRALFITANERKAAASLREPAQGRGRKSRSRSAWQAVSDGETERLERHQPAFKGSNSIALTAAAVSCATAYIVHSFVDFNLHIPANCCMMAFIFAVLANPGISVSSASHGSTGGLLSTIFQKIPAALGLWLLIGALPKWPGEFYLDQARRRMEDGRLLLSSEVASDAQILVKKGLAYDAKNPELYSYLGETQFTLGMLAENPEEAARQYEESIVSYKKAVDLSPQDVRYWWSLAVSLDSLERYDEAETVLARALRLDPNSARIHSIYGAHLQRQKKLEEAEAEYATAFKLANTHLEASRLHAIRKEIEARNSGKPAPAAPPP